MRRALTALAVCLVGCSALNPPSDHLAEPVQGDDFCSVYAEVMCGGVLDCCPGSAGTSLEDCRAIIAPFCATTLATLIGDARTGYDPEEAGYQLSVARRLAETCDPAINAWQNRFDGLVSVLRGTVPEGELCNPIFPESFPDRRLDTPRFYSCADGLACRPTTSITEWRCLNRGEAGAVCTGLGDCATGLTCIVVSDTRAECRDRLPDGSMCGTDSQCESYDCSGCVGDACRCQPDDTPEQVYCSIFG